MSNARESKKETGKGGKILVTSNEGKSKKEKGVRRQNFTEEQLENERERARENRRRISDERRRTEREAAKQEEDEREGEGKWLSSNLSLLFAEVSLL